MTQSSQLTELLQPVAGGMDRMRGILMEQVLDSSAAVRDMTGHVGRFRGKELRGDYLVSITFSASVRSTSRGVRTFIVVVIFLLLVALPIIPGYGSNIRIDELRNFRFHHFSAIRLWSGFFTL